MVDLLGGSRVLLLAAGVVLLGLAVRTYRTQSKPVGRSFSLLISLLGATAFCLSITAGAGTANKFIWLVTNLSIPFALLAFSANYYGIALFRSRARTAAEKIIETTQSLVGAAETARDIERMMETPGIPQPTAVDTIVNHIVSEIRSTSPAVDVTTAIPSDATARVSPEALETVLFNLVENAAEHNDNKEPLVVVSADQTDDGLTIAVSDNGPGIPDHEQAVLETGGEDQLQHGSGLGLWAVYWGITQLGGTFSITDNEPRGTTVTISLPARSTPDSQDVSAVA